VEGQAIADATVTGTSLVTGESSATAQADGVVDIG
jgi:hypothetical protein